MSVFTSGAADTNAKLVRSLANSLTKLRKPERSQQLLLTHCCNQLSFATLSVTDSEVLFKNVAIAFSSENEQTRSFSLQLLHHAVPSVPIHHLCAHWLPLAQKLISVIKSDTTVSDWRFHSQSLTALACLVAIGRRILDTRPDLKSVLSNICQSALQHATRALKPSNVSEGVIMAALSVILAVLHTAPREVRPILSRLEHQIHERWLSDQSLCVRETGAKLFAHLLVCYADKLKAKVFESRLNDACKELSEILDFIEVFSSSKKSRASLSNVAVRDNSLAELERRYSIVCACIRYMIQQHCEALMPTPLCALYQVLLRGIEERYVDPYATGVGTRKIDTDEIFVLIGVIVRESADTLVVVTGECGKDAALPFMHAISKSLEVKLSHIQLRSRTETGKATSMHERRLMYRTLAGLMDVIGCGLGPNVSSIFEKLFSVDLGLHRSNCERLLSSMKQASAAKPFESGSSKKRKRYDHGNKNKQPISSKKSGDSALVESAIDRISEGGQSFLRETLECGLEVAMSLFEYRGFISETAAKDLRKIEESLWTIMEDADLMPSVLRAANGAALSGGSNRMTGEASLLLLQSSRLSTLAMLSTRSTTKLRMEARRSRSACESLFHPRGPPLCFANRICNNNRGAEIIGGQNNQQMTKKEQLKLSKEVDHKTTNVFTNVVTMTDIPSENKTSVQQQDSVEIENVHAKFPDTTSSSVHHELRKKADSQSQTRATAENKLQSKRTVELNGENKSGSEIPSTEIKTIGGIEDAQPLASTPLIHAEAETIRFQTDGKFLHDQPDEDKKIDNDIGAKPNETGVEINRNEEPLESERTSSQPTKTMDEEKVAVPGAQDESQERDEEELVGSLNFDPPDAD